MPYMRISATKKLTEEEQAALANGLGEALGKVPGKNGSMLILDLEDGKTMLAGGVKQDNFVFIDARYSGKQEYHIKKAFTLAVFDAVKQVLHTPTEKISLNLMEMTTWGGFGNFKDIYYKED